MDYKELAGKHERLNRRLKLKFASYFEDLDITATQAMVLEYVMLRTESGIPIYPKDLELFLFVRGSSVTSLVNNLVAQQLLQRVPAEFDGRYHCLVPSRKAWDMQKDITRRIDAYNEDIFKGISDEDLAVYESVMEKMTENAALI